MEFPSQTDCTTTDEITLNTLAETGDVQEYIRYHVNKHGASFNPIGVCLATACQKGHTTIAGGLIDRLPTPSSWVRTPSLHCRRSSLKNHQFSPLMLAAHAGRTELCSSLLGCDDVNLVQDGGWSALMLAASWGHLAVCKVLVVEGGANVDVCDEDGNTALTWAADMGQVEVCRFLLAQGARLNEDAKPRMKPLSLAARSGSVATLQVLLEYSDLAPDVAVSFNQALKEPESARSLPPDTPIVALDGMNPLMVMASVPNSSESLRKLIKNDQPTVNAATTWGHTALMCAARNGNIEAVRVLLGAGATVDQAECEGDTALFLAAYSGHDDVVRELLRSGAAVDKRTECGFTSMLGAAQEGHAVAVRVLLEAGAAVNPTDEQGHTALMVAAYNGQADVLRVLLNSGAVADEKKEGGWAALHLASQEGHDDVVGVLLKSGADVDIANAGGWTPLMVAARAEKASTAQLLVHAGAAVDKPKPLDGQTALMIASKSGSAEVVGVLVDGGAVVNKAMKQAKKARKPTTALRLACFMGHVDVARTLLGYNRDAIAIIV